MTKIGFYINDFSATDMNAYIYLIANLNSVSGRSVIITPTGATGELQQIFNRFPIINYSTPRQLDEVCISNAVKIFYRVCSGRNDKIIPTIIPSCIHCTEVCDQAFGDIYLSLPIVPNALGLVRHGVLASEYIKNNFSEIENQFFKPARDISHSIGVHYDSIMAIFLGVKSNENIPVFPTPMLTEEKNEPEMPRIPTIVKEEKTQEQPKTSYITPMNKYKVKLLCNWTTDLYKDWGNMDPCGRVEVTDKDPDYYVIINKPLPGDYFDPSKTIVFRMEPNSDSNDFYSGWLKDYPRENFLYFLDHEHFRNNSEWWLNKTLYQLNTDVIKKTSNAISSVLSSQYSDKGHRLRIDFVKYIQEHSSLPIDVYGRDNLHNLQNHKGELPARSKEDGIYPYKYTFAAENHDIKNYFTEKIIDAILGEAVCFYWGCSNLEDFIDPKAFIRLDLENPEKSLRIVRNAIVNDEWGKRIEVIRKEKKKIINHFNFFSRVQALLDIHTNIKFNQVSIFPSKPIPGIRSSTVYPNSIVLSKQEDITQVCMSLRNYALGVATLEGVGRLNDHFRLWEECIISNKVFCNMENNPSANFLDHLSVVYSARPADWDVIILNWNNRAMETDHYSRNILEPFWPYIISLSTSSNQQGDKTIQLTDHGFASRNYMISPQGARKLHGIFSKYGYLFPLDELFLLIHTIQPDFKSFICWKNLTENPSPKPGKVYHIFRKTPSGFSNEPVPFSYPPVEGEPIMLMPEDEVQQQISKAKAGVA